MGFLAAAIPIAMSVLGSMGKKEEEGSAGPALPPPPSLGEIVAQNNASYTPGQFIQGGNPFSQFNLPPTGEGRQ